jgi:FAD:protein FMN transferase
MLIRSNQLPNRLPQYACLAGLLVAGCGGSAVDRQATAPAPGRTAATSVRSVDATEGTAPASASAASAGAVALVSKPRCVVAAEPILGFTPQKVWAEGSAMGTHLAFAAYTNPCVSEAEAQAAFAAAIVEVKRIEALMTTWRPESELSRVNAEAGKQPVVVSDESLFVVERAQRMSELSAGTFDITFETLHGLWKFDEDLDPHPPTAAAIQLRLKDVGYKHVRVDREKKTLFIDNAGTKLSLGGIAKGYAVDKAAAVLAAAGLNSFFVQAGGDLYAKGKKPDGSDWTAGIRDPRGPAQKSFATISLSDHAFSTAGDYERSYVIAGKRYHHILDPRTGYPATACRSVTVWARTALVADELDDAVFILGPEKGLPLVEAAEGAGAVVVDASGKVWVSKRLEGKVRMTGTLLDAP